MWITVGCAGFPVPATRYFKEFLFTEVPDLHISPGMGTIRRWRREAPKGFVFAMLAPREIGQELYRAGKIVDGAIKALTVVGMELSATTSVFVAPAELSSSRANKGALKEFLTGARKKFETIVWEPPPSWDSNDADSLANELGVTLARDPLVRGPSSAPVAYYRMPGPAGHKSRYEDPAIEKLAEIAQAASHREATYVFTNVDMFADAKRFKRAMKL